MRTVSPSMTTNARLREDWYLMRACHRSAMEAVLCLLHVIMAFPPSCLHARHTGHATAGRHRKCFFDFGPARALDCHREIPLATHPQVGLGLVDAIFPKRHGHCCRNHPRHWHGILE